MTAITSIPSSEPAIAVLPYGRRLGPTLARVSLDELTWPLGRPERLTGGAVGDLLPTDHLLHYPRTDTHYRLRRGTQARISLILGEPSVIHAKHHRLLRYTHRRFYKVFTFAEGLMTRIPNAHFMPYGTTWVPEWRDLPVQKTGMCSLIASAKRDSTGHKLRHQIVDWVRDSDQPVEIMGRGYTPFDRKSDGLAPYRYSIVIENVQERNYFSEKLLDAVLCNTIPIYWGCPNLDQFCDPTGIIQFNSADDIQRAVENMSEADFQSRLSGIQALQIQLAEYADLELRAARAIRDSL